MHPFKKIRPVVAAAAIACSFLACGPTELDPPFAGSGAPLPGADANPEATRLYFDAGPGAVLTDAAKSQRSDAETDVAAPGAFEGDGGDARHDATTRWDASDAADARAAVPELSCALARVCFHADPLHGEGCLERAVPDARRRAQAVLSCELGVCAASCDAGASSGPRACDVCLLASCRTVLESCMRASGCGDGQRDSRTESCDDGNDVETDDCTNACTPPDDHDAGDACADVCGAPACGNGIVEGTETCDDGNEDAFDGCSACAVAADHLLLTEIVTRPAGAEMIEIFNPLPQIVELSRYAISDSASYYRVASGDFPTQSGSDFAAQFPDGALIGPGAYRTVAIGNASGGSVGFEAAYGKKPDFEIRPLANGATDDPAVPNMRSAQEKSSIGALASLTDAGEPVVLFLLAPDGRVGDVDYVYVGAQSSANPAVDKTGIATGESTYFDDTTTALQSALSGPPEGGAIHRCVYAESGENRVFGNGITGHDETSEPWAKTFVVATSAEGRTPGAPPPVGLCAP